MTSTAFVSPCTEVPAAGTGLLRTVTVPSCRGDVPTWQTHDSLTSISSAVSVRVPAMEGAQEPVGCRQHRDPAAQPGSPGMLGERRERGPSVSRPQASGTEFRTRQVPWIPGLLTTRQRHIPASQLRPHKSSGDPGPGKCPTNGFPREVFSPSCEGPQAHRPPNTSTSPNPLALNFLVYKMEMAKISSFVKDQICL